MAAGSFARAVQELLQVSKAHATLFLFGPGLVVLTPQRSIKPAAHCGASAIGDYEPAIVYSFLFVFAAFLSGGAFVKARVPAAATDGAAAAGLQSLGAYWRRMLRGFAVLGFFLNVAASLLAICTYTFIVQAKVGYLSCLVASYRAGIYLVYVLLVAVLGVLYIVDGKAVLFDN